MGQRRALDWSLPRCLLRSRLLPPVAVVPNRSRRAPTTRGSLQPGPRPRTSSSRRWRRCSVGRQPVMILRSTVINVHSRTLAVNSGTSTLNSPTAAFGCRSGSKEKLEVIAHALLVSGEHPEDTPDTVQRAVMLTVVSKAPDGKQVLSRTMRVERVVAKRGPEGWRVEDVSFFPENEFRTQTQVCPPGQSRQPPPDGPCKTIPPPPAKQCPDGTAVPPDQVCPPPQTGPQTKQCPDGTSIPAAGECPRRRRPKNARAGRRCPPNNPAHPRPAPTDRHATPTEPANVLPGQCNKVDVPSSRRGFGTRNNPVLASQSP